MASVVKVYNGGAYGDPIDVDIDAVADGNTLLVAIMLGNGNAPASITDNGGADPVYEIDHSFDIGGYANAQFYRRSNINDAPTVVSVDPTGGAGMPIYVLEVEGLDNAAPVGTLGARATGTSTTPNAPFTTTVDNDLALMFIAASNGVTQTGGSGWIPFPGTEAYEFITYNNNVGAAGVKNATLTMSGNMDWIAGAVTYRAASAGGTNGTATGITITLSASEVLGAATGQRNATTAGSTNTTTASFVAGSASGEVNGTAAGDTLEASTSFVAGAASGQRNDSADGVTIDLSASMVLGAASAEGSATAPGATIEAAASIVLGAATGVVNGTAPGAVFDMATSEVAGDASGEVNGNALGAVWVCDAYFEPGLADAGGVLAPGAIFTMDASFIAGGAEGERAPLYWRPGVSAQSRWPEPLDRAAAWQAQTPEFSWAPPAPLRP